MNLTAQLKERALALGFNMVGITAARPSRHLQAYLDWIEQARHGEMGYMARPDRVIRRQDLNVILPGVQSIVSVGLDYETFKLPATIAQDPSRGRISNYAWGADYHDIMTPRLKELGAWLASVAKEDVSTKVYVDTGAILERDHGQSAGLGFTGKNTMLIDPRRGSWFFLGELLTTAALVPDIPWSMPGCGSCSRCLEACPTAAFPEPYVLDARRCISYLTIELKGWVPRDLRPLLGNWIYGCDICQAVCPFNRFAPTSREVAFYPTTSEPEESSRWLAVAPPLLTLLTLDEAGFQAHFGQSPIKRIKRARLLRNACIAAGNWGSPEAVPALVALLADDSPLVRGHAAWALGQIKEGAGKTAVEQALIEERDEDVRREMGWVTIDGNADLSHPPLVGTLS